MAICPLGWVLILYLIWQKNSDILFVICVRNPKQVIELEKKILRATSKFLGYQSHLAARKLMNRCDVLLMLYQKMVSIGPAESDTLHHLLPMKMFEYMLTGKPIIPSNLEVLQEVLIDKKMQF